MSTSSSDLECDYYNYSYTPIQPLYPGLGRPLIYYAQIQKKQKNQQSGKKNNCFLKAFRWYTEEHVPLKKSESGPDNGDVQGFAAWLDQKYDEYIRKNQMAQITSSQYLLKQMSTVRTNKLTQNIAYASVPRKNKMKSPWRKRQKHLNKQNGDALKKSDQSIEIILNAKSLSRSASECCQKCHHSNNAITIDANSPKVLKSKSESIIYILKEKEMYVVPSDDTVIDAKNPTIININNEESKNKSPKKDISCQCSNQKLEKVDFSNQFSQNIRNLSKTKVANQKLNCPCTGSQTGICPGVSKDIKVVSSARPSASLKSVPNTHSASASRETSFFCNTNIGKNEPSFSVNGIAQTSEHAINLSHINPEYPMFLKIICANK